MICVCLAVPVRVPVAAGWHVSTDRASVSLNQRTNGAAATTAAASVGHDGTSKAARMHGQTYGRCHAAGRPARPGWCRHVVGTVNLQCKNLREPQPSSCKVVCMTPPRDCVQLRGLRHVQSAVSLLGLVRFHWPRNVVKCSIYY